MSKSELSVKELSALIRGFVKKELATQKEQLIKEIKAELFDVIMSGPVTTPTVTSAGSPDVITITEEKKDISGEDLRRLFESKYEQVAGSPTTIPTSVTPTPVTPTNLPGTYTGPPPTTEAHKEVMDALNRDYSELVKAMI